MIPYSTSTVVGHYRCIYSIGLLRTKTSRCSNRWNSSLSNSSLFEHRNTSMSKRVVRFMKVDFCSGPSHPFARNMCVKSDQSSIYTSINKTNKESIRCSRNPSQHFARNGCLYSQQSSISTSSNMTNKNSIWHSKDPNQNHAQNGCLPRHQSSVHTTNCRRETITTYTNQIWLNPSVVRNLHTTTLGHKIKPIWLQPTSHNRNLHSTNYTTRPETINTTQTNQLWLNRNLHTSTPRTKVIQFNLADIGEGIREVQIKEWNEAVQVGSSIAEFDTVCEVESDKATVSITSRYSGTVVKVYHSAGDVALVGKPLIDIEVDDEGVGEIEAQGKGEIDGETGKIGAKVEVQSGKEEAERTQSGTDRSVEEFSDKNALKDNNELKRTSQIGEELNEAFSETTNTSELEQRQSSAAYRQDNEPRLNRNKWKILATPAVRRMIKQYEIDTKELRGTGKQGRVLKEDIVNYMNSPVGDGQRGYVGEASQHVGETSKHGGEASKTSVIPIRGYVKAMFKSMTEANTIPTLRLTEQVDTTQLSAVKSELSQLFAEKFQLKLTYMPFFLKALSLCVSEFPILNASVDGESILVHPQHNIAVAIDTKHGLVVPHIKDVANLRLEAITRELLRLQACAREGKVSPSDIRGSSISLSNVGNVGGTLVQPIIMPPHVTIVALARIQTFPRFDSAGSVVARSLMNVTWAADHRVVDGATVARAATLWRQLVENPSLLLAQ